MKYFKRGKTEKNVCPTAKQKYWLTEDKNANEETELSVLL